MIQKNFKLIIEYLGTSYNGWQYQPNCPTVQGEIQSALEKILHKNKQDINLIGSGRTDSGVHALAQTANILLTTDMDAFTIKNALNANLKNDIFIKDCLEVDLNFNSRFSAKKRCYIYKITQRYSPFINNREWFNSNDLNIELMKQSAKYIIGEHDFSLLSKDNPEIKNKNCKIYLSKWENSIENMIYTIEGNRFLHHMVRYLVGAMVEIGKKNISLDYFKRMLGNEKSIKGSIYKAPAEGLYLKKICYE